MTFLNFNYSIKRVPIATYLLTIDIIITASTNAMAETEINVRENISASYLPIISIRAEASKNTLNKASQATKSDILIKDNPQSIQILNRDLIQEQQTTSLNDALSNISNVQPANTGGNRSETYFIRGFQSVSYAIDGFAPSPVLDRAVTLLDFANVEQIEVLKGPSSTLFGRSDPGGVINITTRKPSDKFSVEGLLGLGSYNFRRAEGSISSPLNQNKTIRALLTASFQKEDSFRKEESVTDKQLLSAVLQWDITSTLKATSSLDYSSHKAPFNRGLIVESNNKINLPRDTYLSEPWSKSDAHRVASTWLIEYKPTDHFLWRNRLLLTHAKVNDTGIDFKSLADDGQTLRRRYTDRTEDSKNISMSSELTFKFNIANLKQQLLIGTDLGQAELNFRAARAGISNINIYNPKHTASKSIAQLNNAFLENVNSLGLYIQNQIDFTNSLKILFGGRYDNIKIANTSYLVNGSDTKVTQDALTGRLGFIYKLSDHSSLYTNAAQSFKPQSGIDKLGSPLDPERGNQYELGIKFEYPKYNLNGTVSIFDITKKNVATNDLNDIDSTYKVLTGEQNTQGVELDLQVEPIKNWSIKSSIGYLKSKITKDNTFTVGNRLPGIPSLSGSLWSHYKFDQGILKNLGFGLGVTAVSQRKGDMENSYSVSGYYRFDANLSYIITKNLEFSLSGKNLTNQYFIEAVGSRMENYPSSPRKVLAIFKFNH